MDAQKNADKPLPTTLFDFAAEERQFLHDLSNPLAIATGMLEAYQDELERLEVQSDDALKRKLTKLETALQRLGGILAEHRPRLIAIQESVKK